ncbi:MAG: XTP/dITP diphosphatase [Nitrospira sp.]|nr:XTP/dITP diphosphatase [bacterium]MBL7047907.1 XTP/dITP diphosphatase [Nitrospira sp.]
MDIVLASRNKKKIQELKMIMESSGIAAGESVNILTADSFENCGEVIEDGLTFEENAMKKALEIAACSGLTAVADDSGLEVDALDGAPGVYSARYAGEGADDDANFRKLLTAMKNTPESSRGARFVCCIAVAVKGKVMTFRGHVEGVIGNSPRGENGFGYDPIFFPEGHDRTFAEMSDMEKHAMSHRGRALEALLQAIKEGTLSLH